MGLKRVADGADLHITSISDTMSEKTISEMERELSIAKRREHMANRKDHVNRDLGPITPQAVKKEKPESGDTPDYIALPTKKKGKTV